MNIDFETIIERDHVRVTCHGTFSTKELLRICEPALATADESHRAATLIDIRGLRIEGHPPTLTDRYDFGKAIAELQKSRENRIAVAVLGNDPLVDPKAYGADVATNRGGLAFGTTDLEDALAWIRSVVGE